MPCRSARVLVVLVACLMPRIGFAAFNFSQITEVMTSYNNDATEQFVEIQMTIGAQTVTMNAVLAAFDASGNYINDVLIVPANLTNGAPGAHWVMATSSFIGVTPDFTIPSGIIPTGGGMICWGGGGGAFPVDPMTWSRTDFNNYVDCVAYGSYSGPTNIKIGMATPLDGDGHSLQRVAPGNNNAADFACGDPATPTNNMGMAGSLPATAPCPATPTPTVTATPSVTQTPTETITATPTSTPFPEDRFKIYKAKTKKNTADFMSPPDPTLADQFESKETEVKKPALLGNPVDENGDGTINATIHLECYAIKDAMTHPKQPKFAGRRVQISNEFGSLTLDVTTPRQLCVPSLQDKLVPPMGPVPPNSVDRFKCYKAKVPKGFTAFAPHTVEADDQFETSKVLTLKKPAELCAPVDVNAELRKNPDVHLMCYTITEDRTPPKFAATDVFTLNEFDSEQLTATKPSLLCVPSLKVDLGAIP